MKLLGFDCSHILYCAGPCTSFVEEIHSRTHLKPHSGGRYNQLTWETGHGVLLDLRNVRICSSCIDRYHDMKEGVSNFDADEIERMHTDADVIIKKHGLI